MTDNTDIFEELMAIAIPITATDRQQAQTFAKQHPQVRAEQVYRNTLAVLVTHRCLHLLGIKSDLEKSNSWNFLHRLFDEVADLYIPDAEGWLECRATYPGDRTLTLPDMDRECIGYVVVQLNGEYREGQVLGFIPAASVTDAATTIPLTDLYPLDVLIDHLCPVPINLRAWLNQKFERGWEPNEELLRPQKQPTLSFASLPCNRGDEIQQPVEWGSRGDEIQQRVEQLYRKQAGTNSVVQAISSANPDVALVHLMQTTEDDEIRWQAAELLWHLDPYHPDCPVISAKDLGFYLVGQTIALMVGLLPKPDHRVLILLRVYPLGQQSHLPPELKLIGLDETSNVLFEVESRQRDDYMQFKFTADEGDRFSVRIVLNDASFTESFVV